MMAMLESALHGLWLSLTFFWQALWALLLGFMLSGIIQAFVSKDSMVTYMGDASPKSVLWATGFGVASTSCSFGDIAATKTLFKKGAHLIPSIAFMVASTNFVVGLSFVIWALLGWEFAVAQAVGAPVLIVFTITLTHFLIPSDETQRVREELVKKEQPVVTDPVCKMRINRENGITTEHKHETMYFCSEECRELFHQDPDDFTSSWKEKFTSWNGWVEAANQTRKDLLMLWKELLFGFLLAGLVAALVPDRFWTTLFEGGGEGVVAVIYNSLLGPIICSLTFVGSVGNVPLAAVLWESGFVFAGVIAFIYADLIVPQLIRIYRKIFGKMIGTRLSIILYVSMAAAGFVVFYLFDAIGLVPAIHETVAREGTTVFGVSPQTILNVVFLGVAAVFGLVLYKGKRKSPEDRIVEDPVTGTEMPVGEADYCTVYEETIYYFESDESREQFRREHEDFLED
jgi:uncharacterized membrane protein YraQ (UPF0718 family)